MNLSGKHILLGLSGGIAAYKACDLVRRLRDAGAEVRVVMTEGATHFLTPLTLQALSGHPVRASLWDETAEAAMGHIELARWADAILIAPASADVMARLAAGLADDLLTTLCLATEVPLFLAPAMNRVMWAHPATQANVQTLAARGTTLFGPAAGTQACGETGEGRMLEPLELVALLSRHLAPEQNRPWAGRRVVITAGPTREALDPVRFLSNRSSGRMGFALAEAARDAGAEVVLVSGPTALPTPEGVTRIDVETALQMRDAVMTQMPCDIFIGTAAVADYRPLEPAPGKIKKTADQLNLTLVKNPDILSEVAARLDRPFVVGFAAETEHVLEHARDKLVRKRLDLIAANRVGEGLAFDQPDNALTVLWAGGQAELPQADKRQLARQLIELIDQRITPRA
ncbi:bifunctional phosphopantothenoylcysteine decarboxylase/phosphopantothenate--cysteine ligase CoaBC [Thiofaba sp. EF100]|uniref:bifunctional phosphopantothenoylcysteine decarboxylase/phosphopantothenate--cysteine ligase CoaBC n=1 Tax=Thiofaba sp. EF100 TaxID=3121274 RepID=UPI003221BAD5